MNFLRKKIPEYIQSSLEQLEKKPQDWLSLYANAYQALSYQNQDMIVRVGKIGNDYLSTMNIHQIIKTGEQWRSYTSMLWSIDWNNVDILSMNDYFLQKEGYVSLLVMGCFHPSGYFREKCLKILVHYPNTLALIMIRMNDWVEEIRDKAYVLAYRRILESSLDELIDASYVFIKIKKSKRRQQTQLDGIEKHYIKRLSDLLSELNIQNLMQKDECIRKAFYQITLEHGLLSFQLIEKLLNIEKNSFCLLLITKSFLQSDEMSQDKLFTYLHHPNFYVRKEAMLCYYQMNQSLWKDIENDLLDRSYTIREYVRFLLKKHTQMNVLEYYIHHLPKSIAILGISEVGTSQDIDILLPYLESEQERIVKVTIQALSRLMKEKGQDIYWRFLLDERISLSKAAFQSIQKNKVHFGAQLIYETYQKSTIEHLSKYLLMILLEEDSWERLPYLLELYYYPYEKMRQLIHLRINQRNPYKKISPQLKEKIMSSLMNQKNNIPNNVQESILFDLKFICKD